MVRSLKQMADEGGIHGQSARQRAGRFGEGFGQQIWLAGMGASRRRRKKAAKVFEALVKEGLSLQRKTQAVAGELGAVTAQDDRHGRRREGQAKAGQWDKLETIFEERTAKALNKLGVPSAKDVDALIKRIDALGAQVAKLSKAVPRRPGEEGPRPRRRPPKAPRPRRPRPERRRCAATTPPGCPGI